MIEAFKNLLATPAPPDLGPGPREGVLSKMELAKALQKTFSDAQLSAEKIPLLRALLLLWHDHLEAAHVIAQDIETPDGSFIHGIMHRREPDYSNAKYWFRRVGQHPCFPEIAARAGGLLDSPSAKTLTTKLLPGDNWDAFAFVDACEDALQNNSTEQIQWLREIQRAEFEILLEHFGSSLAS